MTTTVRGGFADQAVARSDSCEIMVRCYCSPINTPLQRGGWRPGVSVNRFNGLLQPQETAEAVHHPTAPNSTPLKRIGVKLSGT